jgi:hypothetical protein
MIVPIMARAAKAGVARHRVSLRCAYGVFARQWCIRHASSTPRNPMENLLVQGVAAVVALAVYFLPSIIADRRKRYDLLTIALFNAVVGWTVFGWLLALYWAFQPNPPKNVAGEIIKSRKIVSMRTFSTMLAERVRLRSSRTRR